MVRNIVLDLPLNDGLDLHLDIFDASFVCSVDTVNCERQL